MEGKQVVDVVKGFLVGVGKGGGVLMGRGDNEHMSGRMRG